MKEEKTYFCGDVVYDDVKVPRGTVVYEEYDADNDTIIVTFELNGRVKAKYRMSVSLLDKFEDWNPTREEMRKKIVSEFIQYAKRHPYAEK